MPSPGFDALTQLFDQIMERLGRIEGKLDAKADLSTVGSLESRIRDLEITRAARDPVITEMVQATQRTSDRLKALEAEASKRDTIDGFRLNTPKRKVAAGGLVTVIGAGVVKGIWDFIEAVFLHH
jgi:hypothetical protein